MQLTHSKIMQNESITEVSEAIDTYEEAVKQPDCELRPLLRWFAGTLLNIADEYDCSHKEILSRIYMSDMGGLDANG